MPDTDGLLAGALASGDDTALRTALMDASGLPGARLNLRVVDGFAASVAALVTPGSSPAEPPVERLEALLDGWAALGEVEAPGDQPAVVLPCAAVRAYGDVGAARPDWWDDEAAKLRRAAADPRWRVREVVAQALQRLLVADWDRTLALALDWAADDDPLVVRAAAAAVAEPPLLQDPGRAAGAAAVQQRAVATYRAYAREQRRTTDAKVLRQALAFTLSVTTAATGDFALLDDLAAASDDHDLTWIAAQNLKKSRLRKLRP